MGNRCEPGCKCGRHFKTGDPCQPGCTCKRHDREVLRQRGKKISGAKKGKPLTEEHKAALKCPPDCDCDKHTLRNSGQFSFDNPGFVGRHHSEETKARLSKLAKQQMEKQFPGAADRAWIRANHPGTASSWNWMMSRCFDEWNASYSRYGGQGITVCERWLDLSNFFDDMGPRPPGRVQIGRLDHDWHYEPGNCQWEIH